MERVASVSPSLSAWAVGCVRTSQVIKNWVWVYLGNLLGSGSRKLDRIVGHWLRTPFSRVLAVEHAPDHRLPVQGASRRVDESVLTVLRADEAGPAA